MAGKPNLSVAQVWIPSSPACYVRISQDPLGKGKGVKRQRDAIKEAADDRGWPVPTLYKDNDISARSGKKRPDFDRLIEDLTAGRIDAVIATHLDRLLRRLSDLERFLDAIKAGNEKVGHNIPIVILEAADIDITTSGGQIIAGMLALIAKNEGDVKSTRLRDQRKQAASEGKAHGPLGYGYDYDQNIILSEAEIIREMARRLLDGDTLYSLAKELNARGVPTPGDGRWDARRVERLFDREAPEALKAAAAAGMQEQVVSEAEFARLLREAGAGRSVTAKWVREQDWAWALADEEHSLDATLAAKAFADAGVPAPRSYWRPANLRAMIRRGSLCGYREYSPGDKRGGSGTLIAPGAWTPILDRETTEAIRRLTDDPDRPVRSKEAKYLLAGGFLRCGNCGSSMHGTPGNGSHRYSCSKQANRVGKDGEPCGGMTIAGPAVEAIVSRAVIDTLADAKVRDGSRRPRAANDADIAAAQDTIVEITQLREKYTAEFANGDLRSDEFDLMRAIWKKRQAAAEKVVGSWSPDVTEVLARVPRGRKNVELWWGSAEVRERREILKLLIEHIEVAPSSKKVNYFDDSRVGLPVWKI